MITASFGNKNFEVSSNRIYTPDDISTELSLSVESQDVEGGKPATYIKGVNLIPLTFNAVLDCRFVDVYGEKQWWENTLLAKTPYYFTLANKPICNNKLLLKSVKCSDIVILNNIFQKMKLELSFEEYVKKGVKKKEETKTSTADNDAVAAEAKKKADEAKKKRTREFIENYDYNKHKITGAPYVKSYIQRP